MTHSLTNLIDPARWARAEWVAMAYAPETGAPVLGFVFRDGEVATEIFAGWRRELGETDADDLIRVAIIEGKLPETPPGYTVHVGLDPHAVADRGAVVPPGSDVWRRMPYPESPHLQGFKGAFEHSRRYLLAPAVYRGQRIELLPHHALGKRRLSLRRVCDVGLVGDPDAGLWEKMR